MMARVFKKILRDAKSDRRLRWANDDGNGGRWFRLRRRPVVDELEGASAAITERGFLPSPRTVERGGPPSLLSGRRR